jgi:DNA-binding transcriptional ArsR family regulator
LHTLNAELSWLALCEGDATVSELAEPFGVALLALSRHLKVLEDAALGIAFKKGCFDHP